MTILACVCLAFVGTWLFFLWREICKGERQKVEQWRAGVRKDLLNPDPCVREEVLRAVARRKDWQPVMDALASSLPPSQALGICESLHSGRFVLQPMRLVAENLVRVVRTSDDLWDRQIAVLLVLALPAEDLQHVLNDLIELIRSKRRSILRAFLLEALHRGASVDPGSLEQAASVFAECLNDPNERVASVAESLLGSVPGGCLALAEERMCCVIPQCENSQQLSSFERSIAAHPKHFRHAAEVLRYRRGHIG